MTKTNIKFKIEEWIICIKMPNTIHRVMKTFTTIKDLNLKFLNIISPNKYKDNGKINIIKIIIWITRSTLIIIIIIIKTWIWIRTSNRISSPLITVIRTSKINILPNIKTSNIKIDTRFHSNSNIITSSNSWTQTIKDLEILIW